ncbi:unnamed protein product [Lota lota]
MANDYVEDEEEGPGSTNAATPPSDVLGELRANGGSLPKGYAAAAMATSGCRGTPQSKMRSSHAPHEHPHEPTPAHPGPPQTWGQLESVGRLVLATLRLALPVWKQSSSSLKWEANVKYRRLELDSSHSGEQRTEANSSSDERRKVNYYESCRVNAVESVQSPWTF